MTVCRHSISPSINWSKPRWSRKRMPFRMPPVLRRWRWISVAFFSTSLAASFLPL